MTSKVRSDGALVARFVVFGIAAQSKDMQIQTTAICPHNSRPSTPLDTHMSLDPQLLRLPGIVSMCFLDATYLLTLSMAYLGHYVNSRDFDLRSNFALPFKINIMFRRVSTGETRRHSLFLLSCSFRSYWPKEDFGKGHL